MNCYETMKISQQYSKIIQKIQSRNEKELKNKKSAQSSTPKLNATQNKQPLMPSPLIQKQKQNIINTSRNTSTNQINSNQSNKDKSQPLSLTPRSIYPAMTPLKKFLSPTSSLSPLQKNNNNEFRQASKTIHNPQNFINKTNTSYANNTNNNVSNILINTTNILNDNSYTSINNHIQNLQPEVKSNSNKQPYIIDNEGNSQIPSFSVMGVNNQSLNINNNQNDSTPKKQYFFNNGKSNENIIKENKSFYKNNNNQRLFECCKCALKNAKYFNRITSKSGENHSYYCSKCAVSLLEQGKKLECLSNYNLPPSSQWNHMSQKSNQDDLLSYTKSNSPKTDLLSNTCNDNYHLDTDEKSFKNIQSPSIKDSDFKIPINHKENIYYPHSQGVQQNIHNNRSHVQVGQFKNEPSTPIKNQCYFENNHLNFKKQSNEYFQKQQNEMFLKQQNDVLQKQFNETPTLKLSHVKVPFAQANMQIISEENQVDSGVKQCQNNLNQEEQQYTLDQGDQYNQKYNCQFDQLIHENNQKENISTSQIDSDQFQKNNNLNYQINPLSSTQLNSETSLHPTSQISQINQFIINNNKDTELIRSDLDQDTGKFNNKLNNNTEVNQGQDNIQIINFCDTNEFQKNDTFVGRNQLNYTENKGGDNDEDQFLPQFLDRGNQQQQKQEIQEDQIIDFEQRKIEIIDRFQQDLLNNHTHVLSCISQLGQRKKEVNKFYENQELKLQNNAQYLIQLIQSELLNSIESLRTAQANTLSLFSEKENILKRIYHDTKTTEADVQKNQNQIVEYMEEIPFNNIISVYQQNLKKNTSTLSELPTQTLCLSKTYQLSEKKQASINFVSGLKDILHVQQKRTTMFGNSSYASATSTPQTQNTNNNSYQLNQGVSPTNKNHRSLSGNTIFANVSPKAQNGFIHNNLWNNQNNQQNIQSQTTSITSSRAYLSNPNSVFNNPSSNQQFHTFQYNNYESPQVFLQSYNNNIHEIHQQQSQPNQNYQNDINNEFDQNKQIIQIQQNLNSNEQVQEKPNLISQNNFMTSDYKQQNYQNLTHHQQGLSMISQQNSTHPQNQLSPGSFQDSFLGCVQENIPQPIQSHSISSPLIKKNNLFNINENYKINFQQNNPYSSVENHIEQVCQPQFNRDDAHSYSSVQYQRWKDCEKTIIEQLMSIEQNESNQSVNDQKQNFSDNKKNVNDIQRNASDNKTDANIILSPTSKLPNSQIFFNISPSKQLFNASTDSLPKNKLQFESSKGDQFDKKLESISEKADNQMLNDVSNSQQTEDQSKDESMQNHSQTQFEENSNKNTDRLNQNNFQDLKNNYQWMIEQYKLEQNLVSKPKQKLDKNIHSKLNNYTDGQDEVYPSKDISENKNLISKDNIQISYNQNMISQNKNYNENSQQKQEFSEIYEWQLGSRDNQTSNNINDKQGIYFIEENRNDIEEDQTIKKYLQKEEDNQDNKISQNRLDEMSNNEHNHKQLYVNEITTLTNDEIDSSNNQTGEFQYNCLSYSSSVAAASLNFNEHITNKQNNNNKIQVISQSDMIEQEQLINQDHYPQNNLQLLNNDIVQPNIHKHNNQITYSLNHQRGTSPESDHLNSIDKDKISEYQNRNNLNNDNHQNLITSFSQNIQQSIGFLEQSLVQNFFNKQQNHHSNQEQIDQSQQLINPKLNDHIQVIHKDFTSAQKLQNQDGVEEQELNKFQSDLIDKSQDSQKDIERLFLEGKQNNNDKVINCSLKPLNIFSNIENQQSTPIKDSSSDPMQFTNNTHQKEEEEEEEEEKQIKDKVQDELYLDLNQLHVISNENEEEDSSCRSGSNSQKRPLKYSEIIQKIHENYNKLSQYCSKRPTIQISSQQQSLISQQQSSISQQQSQVSQSQSQISQSQIQSQTQQSQQIILNSQGQNQNYSNTEQSNKFVESQNIQIEESLQLFGNHDMHYEIMNNLLEMQQNNEIKRNQQFQNHQDENKMNQQNQIEQQTLISLVEPNIQNNEFQQAKTIRTYTISDKTNNIHNYPQQCINTVESFNQNNFNEQNNFCESFNQNNQEYLNMNNMNNQKGEYSFKSQDELKVTQHKQSTFSSFLDTQQQVSGVSSNIEAQINNHITNQIQSSRKIKDQKYSELIKSSPHFKVNNLTDDDSLLSDNDNDDFRHGIQSDSFHDKNNSNKLTESI